MPYKDPERQAEARREWVRRRKSGDWFERLRAEGDPRRCVPVRLLDVPLDERLAAARRAINHEEDPDERQALLGAALFPSDRVYWIAP